MSECRVCRTSLFSGTCIRHTDVIHIFRELGRVIVVFFFNDTATTEIYTLSLHDALPISLDGVLTNIAPPDNTVIVGFC